MYSISTIHKEYKEIMARNTLFQWLDISMRLCLLSSHSLAFLKHEEKQMRACKTHFSNINSRKPLDRFEI